MSQKFTYPWWAKIYTVWWALAATGVLFAMDLLWIESEYFLRGYILILVLIFLQYLLAARQVKYWPISVEEKGVRFLSGKDKDFVSWDSILYIKEFPTAEFQPIQWYQAMMSSGFLIFTNDGREYVVYKKVSGYREVLNEAKRHS